MAIYHDYYVYVLFRRKPRVEPFYVGMGRGDRWKKHEGAITNRKDPNAHKKNIIKQMLGEGVEVPKIKVAEGLDGPTAIALEIVWIAAIGRRPNGPLVNRTNGGDRTGGMPKTASHREAIARALRGKKKPREMVDRIAAKLRGRKASAETRVKMSKARKGKPKPLGFAETVSARRRGQKASEETKAQMSAIKKASPQTAQNIATLAALNRGRKQSFAARQKKSLAHAGKRLSDSHKQAIKEGQIRRRQRERELKSLGQQAQFWPCNFPDLSPLQA